MKKIEGVNLTQAFKDAEARIVKEKHERVVGIVMGLIRHSEQTSANATDLKVTLAGVKDGEWASLSDVSEGMSYLERQQGRAIL